MPDLIISSVITGTINEFIDWAMVIVLLMFVYYLFRLIFFGPGESEEQLQGRRDRFGNWIKEQKDKKNQEETTNAEAAKKQHEANSRRRLLEPVKGFVIRVERTTENMSDYLTHQSSYSHAHAENFLHSMNSNLRSARRTLHVARMHSKGDKRDFMSNLSNYVQAMEEVIRDSLRVNLPHNNVDPNWGVKAGNIRNNLSQLKSRCGVLIRSIDDFIDADRAVAPTIAAGATGGTGTPTGTGRGPPTYHP